MASELRLFGEFFAEAPRNGLTRPKAVRGSGIKMVNMGELFAYSRLRDVPMDRVLVSEPELARFKLEGGDLLFARQSLVLEGAGQCSIFLHDDEAVTFESHIIRVRLDPLKADSRFYFYYLKSHHGQAAIRSIVEQGAGASGIRGSELKNLNVHWLRVERQRKAADTLSSLDDKIELNQKTNDTLEAMARALFQSWFVNFDPVRAKAAGEKTGLPNDIAASLSSSLVDSDIGEIPAGWILGTLNHCASANPESWLKHNRPESICYVDLANTKWGKIVSTTLYAQSDAPSRAQRVLRIGDTIVGTVRPGNGSYSFISEDGLTGSTAFAVLRPRSPEWREFVYLAATAQENIDRLTHLADGGAYPAVRPEAVISTPVVIPPPNLVKLFSHIVGSWFDRISATERESVTFGKLRDALLPRLIAGELDLPFVESEVHSTWQS